MLPKSHRLNLKQSFTWAAAGEKIDHDLLKLFFRFGQNEVPKIGIAPSKANFATAVARNRAKRLVAKGFENLLQSLPKNVNIVALPKTGILKKSSDEVTAGLKEMLEKARLWKTL